MLGLVVVIATAGCGGDGGGASVGGGRSGTFTTGRPPIQGASELTVAQQNQLLADIRTDRTRLQRLSPAEQKFLSRLLAATERQKDEDR